MYLFEVYTAFCSIQSGIYCLPQQLECVKIIVSIIKPAPDISNNYASVTVLTMPERGRHQQRVVSPYALASISGERKAIASYARCNKFDSVESRSYRCAVLLVDNSSGEALHRSFLNGFIFLLDLEP